MHHETPQLRPTNLQTVNIFLLLALFHLLTHPFVSAHYVSAKLPVDQIYVIGLKQCTHRWARVRQWAAEQNLTITPVFGTRYDEIDLITPPIPIAGMKRQDIVMAGQLACTMSHIRTWRDAFKRNFSRIVVLEDDVRITPSLMSRFPHLLSSADKGSEQRHGAPWHFIYLRMHPTEYNTARQIWHGDLREAHPGWGTAAYVVSWAGIRLLLTRITAYSCPLDVQLNRLQRGFNTLGADFLALDGCNSDESRTYPAGCPENIRELLAEERGDCAISSTQAGDGYFGYQMPGAVDAKLEYG